MSRVYTKDQVMRIVLASLDLQYRRGVKGKKFDYVKEARKFLKRTDRGEELFGRE